MGPCIRASQAAAAAAAVAMRVRPLCKARDSVAELVARGVKSAREDA